MARTRHSECYRWNMRAPIGLPTIIVTELPEDVKKEREERIKKGARVVPFGFARVLEPAAPAEPQLWEGDYA